MRRVSCVPRHCTHITTKNHGNDGEAVQRERLWRIAGLPLGSSLPISSGKALVQTETRLVSNTRREQVGGEEALRNQQANTSQGQVG